MARMALKGYCGRGDEGKKMGVRIAPGFCMARTDPETIACLNSFEFVQIRSN
jgi:hypothetical protein